MSETRYVYKFSHDETDGDGRMKEVLGGKGAGLAEMTRLGLPVPPGFTIATNACTEYYRNGRQRPAGLDEQVDAAMAWLEGKMGRRFGDPGDPLLVSVRSGAKFSMPGMMDTVLNLGLNDQTMEGLAAKGGARFAADSFRRFIQMYSNVVLNLEGGLLETELHDMKVRAGAQTDQDLTADQLRELVGIFRAKVQAATGKPFPTDPRSQLIASIEAVFASWNNKRAIEYRNLNGIPHDLGTAVNVQAMVFGNQGDDCATGVCFTRDPSTGERRFFGEYLPNAQGEDVVAGIRTPRPISGHDSVLPSLEATMPVVYQELVDIYHRLEAHYRDMQDMEFTVERGKLWMLQTRNGKRTAKAAIRIAVEMVGEGLIDRRTAVLRVQPKDLDQLLHPQFDPKAIKAAKAERRLLATGLAASPGAEHGQIVFSAEDAVAWAAEGKQVILVRNETSPEDLAGMNKARAVLTARGGMTSHAAVVARGMGKCCVAGCGALAVSETARTIKVGDRTLHEGEVISVDGSTGEVFLGSVATVAPDPDENFETLMGWADGFRRLKVRANADTPHDAEVARGFGAQGIGLCRTEHMFFSEERILAVREMILAPDEAGRRKALDKLLPMQRGDFRGIFQAMKGLPVTIRLLDPPLHEFLPQHADDIRAVAEDTGATFEAVKHAVETLHEMNPMLGHRGCRLGVTYPEIYEMQVRAIMEAACELVRDDGYTIVPEIMIPLVSTETELAELRTLSVAVAEDTMARMGVTVEYLVGTMIELPRAAIKAHDIAKHADFFSFGTNDLTQTTFGLSRDDAGKFLPRYVEKGVLKHDPFVVVDDGVAELVQMAVDRGRSSNPHLHLGICGEHGGEPISVHTFHRIGLDYVSCSPFRVPIARLAAAHATLEESK
ncbi:MAG: pyruvate, phosphate dikinase [Myxococcales bacterium]